MTYHSSLDSSIDLARLSARVAVEGSGPLHRELAAVARMAAGVVPGAAAALIDPTSPEIVRQRALAVIARRLPQVTLLQVA